MWFLIIESEFLVYCASINNTGFTCISALVKSSWELLLKWKVWLGLAAGITDERNVNTG